MNGDTKKTGIKFFSYLKTHAVIVGHHIFIGGFGFLVITVGIPFYLIYYIFMIKCLTVFYMLKSVERLQKTF